MKNLTLLTALAAVFLTPNVSAATLRPSDVLYLNDFYITLPTNKISNPDIYGSKSGQTLVGYENKPYFYAEGDSVVFRAPVDGAHTKNSKYTRSELREMQDGKLAKWSTTKGTHTMEVEEAIMETAKGEKPELVSAQLHGAKDDIVLIHYSDKTKQLVAKYDDTKKFVIDPAYKIGTKFTIKMVASNGKVQVFYNGQLKGAVLAKDSGSYWKAGTYSQAKGSGWSEVRIYKLKVTHS